VLQYFFKKTNLRNANIQRNESHANGQEMILEKAKTNGSFPGHCAMK